MTMKKWRTILISLLLILTLGGCDLGQPQIGVTTYPIEYLVKRIAGDKVSVLNITQTKTITRAQLMDNPLESLKNLDVLFVLGKLEPYLSVHIEIFNQLNLKLIEIYFFSSKRLFRPL